MTKYYGKYRGMVLNNIDPMQIGRLQVQVPDVAGLLPVTWAMPCAPVAGIQNGVVAFPMIGSGVWIEFEHGDPDYPVWTGCWWGSATEIPTQWLAPPYKKVMLMTPSGHSITVDDTPGVGGITLQTAEGAKVVLSSTGCQFTNGQGATVQLTGPQVSVNNGALDVT